MEEKIRNEFNKILIETICEDIGLDLEDIVKDQIFNLNDDEFELAFYEYTDETIEETIDEIIENMG